MPKRAVVLLSGGLDSATAAALARRDGWELYGLTVRYGQVHACEIDAARRVAAALGFARHVELSVDLAAFGGSALTGDGAVPKDRPLESADIPSTYVPARNTVLLSLALAWAEVVGAERIVIGVNALDYSGYPDCRPEYVAAFERLAALATKAGVEGRPLQIWAPLQHLTKADIIRRGVELGLDYGLTHSCYDPSSEGRPCGRCDSCRLRAKGFEEAGVADPGTSEPRNPGTVTQRLYYTDALQRSFEATVLSCLDADGRCEVVLDETAFYPASGGQPHDTGTLGGQRVIDVVDRDDGGIVHVVDAAIPPGARVTGDIEWTRRFDHMQQHTGQHVLSAAFDRLFGVRTQSFHLGTDVSTIDLAREMSAAEIGAAEAEANRVVWDDRPVRVRFADAEEAARLPLRKETARAGELRLVDVTDFDLSACGGTHVPSTGMIGLIAVVAWERFKAGSRVSFVCGARALRSHARLRDAGAAVSRVLSVPVEETPAAIERLQQDARAAAKSGEVLQEELSTYRAAALRLEAETIQGMRVVLSVQRETAAGGLKRLAGAIVAAPGHVAVIVGDGDPAPVAIARSPDVDLNAGAWMKRAAESLGGRGGGRPDQAQGGISASADAILAFARASLRK